MEQTESGQTESVQTDVIKALETEIDCPKNAKGTDSKAEEHGFEDSTHGYLITFNEHSDISNLLLAILLYATQMCCYFALWMEAKELISKDQVEVTVGFADCAAAGGKRPDMSKTFCEAEVTSKWYHVLLPVVLLAIYIQPDMISCVSIMFSKKSYFIKRIMALIVMSESVYALLTGLLWSFQGIYEGSGYDAIVNSIGVLFVHELDEQLFVSVERMNADWMRSFMSRLCKGYSMCQNFCALFCTILFLAVVGVSYEMVEKIANGYIKE